MSELRLRAAVRPVVKKNGRGLRPYIALEHVESDTGRLLLDAAELVPAGDNLAFEPDDVLFGKLRPYLAKSVYISRALFGSPEFLCLRAGPRLHPRYLYYLTLSRRWVEWATASSYGSKMPRTSWDAMADFMIEVPPLDEQRRIADFLDDQVATLDRAIVLANHEVALRTQRHEAVVDAQVESRFSSLRWTRLGYLTEQVTSGPRGWAEFLGTKGIPFFRSANLRRDSMEPRLENLALVDPAGSRGPETARASIRLGDVLIGITGANAGWVCRVREEALLDGVVSQHVACVRPDRRSVRPDWVAYLLSSSGVRGQLSAMQYGGTKTQLSLPNLRDLRVPVPSLAEQDQVLAILDDETETAQRFKSLLDHRVKLLSERKRALVTAAVTGQFDVTAARAVA